MARDSDQDRPNMRDRIGSDALNRGVDALLQAKQVLERLLQQNATWQSLRQVRWGTRATSIEEADEARELRERLAHTLAAEPAYDALRNIEAALESFAPTSEPRKLVATDVSRDLQSDEGARGLPAISGPPARLAALLPSPDHREGPSISHPTRYDDGATRFSPAAIGIEEAQVKIVASAPPKAMLNFTLPPSPFARTAEPSSKSHSDGAHNEDTVILLQSESTDDAEIAIARSRVRPR